MNWTGGRLQRHSNSDTLATRQKRHFAKVRTQLRQTDAANNLSPFKPRFLQPGGTGCEALDGALGSEPPLKRQKGLDQDETVAPLVQRLTSMKPRPPAHRHISRRSTHDSPNAAVHPSVPSCEGNLTLPPQAAVVSCEKAKNDRETNARKAHDRQERYGEKRQASDGVRADDVVERQRVLLLARRDWAGIEPSRPVRMRFPSSKERESIGKGQKTFRNKTHRTARDGAPRAPFPEGDVLNLGGPWMSGALVDENIDIKICTEAFSGQVSAAGSDSHEAGWRLTPSDPMLFDLGGPVYELDPICAPEYLTTDSPALQQGREKTQDSTNLPETGTGSSKNFGGAEADPVEDVERLLQELDGSSYRGPAAPALTGTTGLAHERKHGTDIDDDHQRETQLSDVQGENLMQLPTFLQELESGREGSSLDQAETRGQTKGQLELQSSPPKPTRLLFMSSLSVPSIQGPQPHSVRASSELLSENPLELPQRPGADREEFDDIRWREFLGVASERTDQPPATRRTGSERRPAARGIGEHGASSSALRDSSVDRASRPCLSAERLIDDAEHGASAWSTRSGKSQSLAKPPDSTSLLQHGAANTSKSSCSSALHPQASGSAPDLPSPGSPLKSRSQITAFAENAPAATAQGWIGDADGGEDAETTWKRFVFGEDNKATIDNPEEERQSLEPAIRSPIPPEWSTASSLSVEASGNSAAAGTPAPSPACAHLHSVGYRYGAVSTADASAGKETTSGEDQASESIAFVEIGSTGEAASPMGSRCLPVRIHDADAQANKASDDATTVAATAGESSGELASLDRRQRIVFTKPKAFVGSMAVARPAPGGAIVEGNASKGTTSHTSRAGIGRKISNPRKHRHGHRTARFSPSIYGIPSRNDMGYASDPIDHVQDY